MQRKDIPTLPILKFLATLNGEWAYWYPLTGIEGREAHERWNSRCVRRAMPEGVPEKLVLAKMRQLIHSGLVDGCDCGCRGDFVLTDKGKALLAKGA